MRTPSSNRPSSRRKRGGFTLVELMISLVMGLIVALAAVALAKAATTTFHEQARSSLTEMGVRTGAERLRQDLMRVSHMSTGNIFLDPKVAHIVGATNSRWTELDNLQGIKVNVAGSLPKTNGSLKLSDNNLVQPDSIVITGNMTTDDGYNGTLMSGGSCGNGQVVRLDPAADAAVFGLLGDAGASTLSNAKAAFRPVDGKVFVAQVIDALGCTHFVPVCDVTVAADVISVHLLGAPNKRAVLYSHSPSGEYENPPGLANNCGSSEGGKVTVSPVHRVRWELQPTTTALEPDPNIEPQGHKFDLTRQLLDFESKPAGDAEVVAEYAVDLKFGLTVYDPVEAAANQDPLKVYDLDSDPGGGAGEIDVTTKIASSTVSGQRGPQHVRSVRFRLATRTSLADRQADIQVGVPRDLKAPYMSRYCMENATLGACKKFARVRTVVSEVALHSQARMFY